MPPIFVHFGIYVLCFTLTPTPVTDFQYIQMSFPLVSISLFVEIQFINVFYCDFSPQ